MYKQIKAIVSQGEKLSSTLTLRVFIVILIAAAILLSTAAIDSRAVSYAGKTTAQMLISVRTSMSNKEERYDFPTKHTFR